MNATACRAACRARSFTVQKQRCSRVNVYESEEYNANKRESEHAVRLARFGLLLMIGGFALQIASNYS